MTDYLSTYVSNELKLRIVNYAGWQAATQLSAVSMHWNDIANDAVFWKYAVKDNFHSVQCIRPHSVWHRTHLRLARWSSRLVQPQTAGDSIFHLQGSYSANLRRSESSLALSASGKIWSVRGSFPTCQPAVIQFLTPKGVINNPICSKVVAGRNFSGALVDNHGLFLWLDSAQCSQPRLTHPRHEDADISIRSVDILRIPFFVDAFGDASHEDRVADFAIGEHLGMLVTSSGRVFALDLSHQQADHVLPMQLVNIVAPRGSPKIDRVEGKFRQFAVFNSNGLVYLLNDENIKGQFDRYIGHRSFDTSKILTGKATPDFIEEFIFNHEIVDISFGDGHALALSDTGKVLTWGRDMGCSGALGHGVRQVAQEIGVRYELRDGILDKPMPVDFGEGDFFAYKVSAGGMRSCALVMEISEESVTV
ncbi:hypothetical protein BZA77DRAFT_368848 [Pyronema omphalodes]|nr:hypothetical protein BZA77DRAFT_368848 [Pyronema omphalodes]